MKYITIILNEFKISNPLTVPSTYFYFEAARKSILLKTVGGQRLVSLVSCYRKPVFYLGMAASFTAVVLTLFFQLSIKKENINDMVLTNDEIMYYLEQFDLKEIASNEVFCTSLELPFFTKDEEILIYADELLILEQQ